VNEKEMHRTIDFMTMILKGEKVDLRPMTIDEKPLFFEWTINSEAAPFLYGELYGEPVPDWDGLFDDYEDFYFDGSHPEQGRCFAILLDGKPIGQVNYNEINRADNSTELDIWIAETNNTGKGLGTDSLKTLIQYLSQNMGIRKIIICPLVQNKKAVRSYEKAGFSLIKSFCNDKGKEHYLMETTLKE